MPHAIKIKFKTVNKAWLNDHINDPYVKMAKKMTAAHDVYKLNRIDEALKAHDALAE